MLLSISLRQEKARLTLRYFENSRNIGYHGVYLHYNHQGYILPSQDRNNWGGGGGWGGGVGGGMEPGQI